MSLLRDFFMPKGTLDKMAMGVILIVVMGFVGYEGYAFLQIMNDPYQEGKWLNTGEMPNDYMLFLGNSELYSVPGELRGDTIFVISLYHLDNLNVNIEFQFEHCTVKKILFADGKSVSAGKKSYFKHNQMNLLNLTDNSLQLNLRDMSFPDNYDMLFIRVLNTGSSGIKLYYKITLI